MTYAWQEPALVRREACPEDLIHSRLKKLVERRIERYLWIPQDAIRFVPPVLSTVYGDGRALFNITTINNRPAFWIIRGDSEWSCSDAPWDSNAVDFGEFTDEILNDLEMEFGSARCGWSGANLYMSKKERGCDCEECSDRTLAKWPMVDGQDGCSWGRRDWPKEFDTVRHPWSWRGNLLRAPTPPIPVEVWEYEGGHSLPDDALALRLKGR